MGGDGGIQYTLKALKAEKINIGRIQFAALPFGSGCDLAQCTGWGKSADERHLVSLHEICQDIT